jgi:hypothetical protein
MVVTQRTKPLRPKSDPGRPRMEVVAVLEFDENVHILDCDLNIEDQKSSQSAAGAK